MYSDIDQQGLQTSNDIFYRGAQYVAHTEALGKNIVKMNKYIS